MSEWVPVTDERKPDNGERVVVYTQWGWQTDEWMGDHWANFEDGEVTHWMRPEAPDA